MLGYYFKDNARNLPKFFKDLTNRNPGSVSWWATDNEGFSITALYFSAIVWATRSSVNQLTTTSTIKPKEIFPSGRITTGSSWATSIIAARFCLASVAETYWMSITLLFLPPFGWSNLQAKGRGSDWICLARPRQGNGAIQDKWH